MTNLSGQLSLFRRNYSNVVGVDVGASGTKVVHLARGKGEVRLLGVDILPPISLSSPVAPIVLPKLLRARYVAIAASSPSATVKLLSIPANSEKPLDTQVGELIGFGGVESDFRVGYERVHDTRTESKVLAVMFSNAEARAMCSLFPEGAPAPCSIEVSGLASMTAYQHGPGKQHMDDCCIVIDFGLASTMVSFFNKGLLVLVRKFDFGAGNILKKLQENLGVDQDVATGILNDGSFDVSRIVHHAMEPFLQQLTISWDFVERREDVHVAGFYACGGGVSLRLWAQEIEAATGQKPVTWNPFDGMAVPPGAIPSKLKGQEPRFAAAIGAALSMLGTN